METISHHRRIPIRSIKEAQNGHSIIFTSKNEQILVDLQDYEDVLKKAPWHCNSAGIIVRPRRRDDKQRYKKFTLVMLTRELFGFPPGHVLIKHKNRNKFDCRRNNLVMHRIQETAKQITYRKLQPYPEWEEELYKEYFVS
jgi:hypothetical protein